MLEIEDTWIRMRVVGSLFTTNSSYYTRETFNLAHNFWYVMLLLWPTRYCVLVLFGSFFITELNLLHIFWTWAFIDVLKSRWVLWSNAIINFKKQILKILIWKIIIFRSVLNYLGSRSICENPDLKSKGSQIYCKIVQIII